jgi:hypothetical protein
MGQRTRAQRLNGLFPLSYMGVVPVSPVNFIIDNRPPTQNDAKNFYIGDLWLDDSSTNQVPSVPPTAENLWMLVDLSGSVATWVHFGGGVGNLQSLSGNLGTNPVFPDVNDNINVVGDGTSINVTGDAGTNTLTISAVGGEGADNFPTDSGTAIPVAGVLNMKANNASVQCGASVLFSGASNTVQLKVSDASTNTLIGSNSGQLSLSGSNNTALGSNSLHSLLTGSNSVCIGKNAGSNYNGSESSNIILGINNGVAAESHTIRIGGGTGTGNGEQNQAFFSGINGITVTNPAFVVIDTVTDQLATLDTPIPAYSTGTFTPGLSFGGASVGIVYGTRTGQYVQIGTMVYVTFSVQITSKGSSTGAAVITGLPFTVSVGSIGSLGTDFVTFDSGFTYAWCITANGTTTAPLEEGGSGIMHQSLLDTNFAAADTVTGSITYFM